jgi:preprotein translocase subunit SecY
LFLASIALMQWWAPAALGLQGQGSATLVGGTSLLIVVGVALEIMQNLDQQLKMRQYEGFARQMEKADCEVGGRVGGLGLAISISTLDS